MPKQLVVILGMHRSGTSLVTKSMELLGYSLGDNLMPAGTDNPTGFWEDLDVVRLNETLLAYGAASWDLPPRSPVHFPAEYEAAADQLLADKFANTSKLALKDPRLCLLLPFWSARFAANQIDARYIFVHRNPLSVAGSLQRRNDMVPAQALMLDYLYESAALSSAGPEPFVVAYQGFLSDPIEALNRMATYLDAPLDAPAASEFSQHFVNPELCHHEHDLAALAKHPDVFPALLDLVTYLTARARDEPSVVPTFHFEADQYAALQALQLVRDVQVKRALEQRIDELSGRAALVDEREKHILALEQDRDELIADVGRANDRLSANETELQERANRLSENAGILAQQRESLNEIISEAALLLKDLPDIEAVNDPEGVVAALKSQKHRNETRAEQLSALHAELADYRVRVDEFQEQVTGYREQVTGYQRHMADFDRIHTDVLQSVSYRLGRLLTFPIRKPVSLILMPKLEGNRGAAAIVRLLRSCIAHPIETLKLLSVRRVRNFFRLLTDQQGLAEQVAGNYQQVLNESADTVDLAEPQEIPEGHRVDLTLHTSPEPLVSVLIPVYNQIEYTVACLQSIHAAMPAVPIEVVIADDCSTDNTAAVLAAIGGVRVVQHPENLGFLRSCNRAIDHCRGDYVYLLNNDTTVRHGWLDTLLEVFDTFPDAGLVGSKLIYPDGTLQEAGGIVWRDASGWNYGRNQQADAPEFNYVKEVDYVSGAAILFPKQLFLDLGKFDEALVPAYYEDTDLAFAMRAAGYRVMYQPASVVVHFEGKSHGTDESAGIKQHQVVNQTVFREKWAEVLDAEHFDNGESVQLARERSRNKTTVLVIDHYVPHYDKDAGSRSTFFYLKLLVSAGCNVKFLGDNFFKHEPYTAALESLGIEVLHGPHYEKNWQQWLTETPGYVDVVYLMRPHIAERYIDFINAMSPRPRTIYFGHDLHYLRLERQLALEYSEPVEQEAKRWRRTEYALFDKFDVIYYPSNVEVAEISGVRPDINVKAIPLYAYDQFEQGDIEFTDRRGLLFVGGFNHPPNADGLRWFIDDVFGTLRQSLPDLVLHVVGSNMPEEIQVLASETIQIHGFLSDDELSALYTSVRISIVPLRFGAGVKGKVLEALSLGVPVVTTGIGAEGIPGAEECLSIADDAEAMAAMILDVYGDEAQLQTLSLSGRETIKTCFSSEAVLNVIAGDFMIEGNY